MQLSYQLVLFRLSGSSGSLALLAPGSFGIPKRILAATSATLCQRLCQQGPTFKTHPETSKACGIYFLVSEFQYVFQDGVHREHCAGIWCSSSRTNEGNSAIWRDHLWHFKRPPSQPAIGFRLRRDLSPIKLVCHLAVARRPLDSCGQLYEAMWKVWVYWAYPWTSNNDNFQTTGKQHFHHLWRTLQNW